MKILVLAFLMFASFANATVDLTGFGIIREFGGSDTAALFGVLPSSGSIQITGCSGPSFLVQGGCRVGQLTPSTMDRLFLKSSKPMSHQEKQDLVYQWNGAQVLYFEAYNGTLCTNAEIEYLVSISGTSNGQAFTTIFQFIALPNANGSCTFHSFGTITKS
jgi:hypothetical protein